ncbi:ROK family protein [Pimelobacter simplex]|uniref:Transcriptional regulator, ROK family protein n=2 Tax=Nocardioides simplex TaxID=2045 RepID=A0A0A1DXJ2_NOCSI|nr:ROK family protein [Pimelobacter simplex]AIY20180.2 transcriptional regulator, ROK family protein [Pimelobacter simplex]GEB16481.1 sugar kinase [Pimelobacter simplex]SFM19666.1 Sugar kinase of the NBD/HSP70 family, may contain an N-terminal HTH domain [Pimelobacter simplex]
MTEMRPPGGRDTATAGDLFALVRAGRAATRADLGRLTGLSRTAVVARVGALGESGLLRVGADLASTGGRPPGRLEVATDAGTVLAVAIGRSRSQVAVHDLAGAELAASAVDHEIGAGPDAVMPSVADQLAGLLVPGTPPVLGIGLSLPGAVDAERGVSVETPVMAGWDGVPLAPYLAGVTEAPLLVANDADTLARSEYLGHAARMRDLLVVKASTGIGLGVLAGGRIVAGALGAAGELGHTKVPEASGRPCRCGDVGCLETIAAGWALVARLRESGREVEHVRDLVAHALAGDPEAKQLLRESGRMVGELLAVAINLLNPRAVVLGGDMAAAFDVYAAGVREAVYARSTALATRELQFLPATYGDRAGLVGCAALALDEVLSPAAVDARLRRAAG